MGTVSQIRDTAGTVWDIKDANAATSGHTHGLSIATDSGTNQLTMAANTKYKLTAGGSTYIFTTPPDNNTNTWRNIQVNGTEILGTGTGTGVLNLKAGSNVSVTNSSGTVTIAATDTTYTSQSAASGDNTVSLCTRNEKYIWNNKSELQLGSTSTTAAPGNHTHSYAGSSTAGGAATQLIVTNTVTDSSYYVLGATSTGSQTIYSRTSVYFNGSTGVLYGAAWNDFAEYRETNAKPGEVVCETLNGDLIKSTKRLQLGAAVISDTYGMIIGDHTDTAQPIAVAGRVLVYIDTLDNIFAGAAVCAAPDGKVSVMTREEIKEYPDAIIGYISEVPKYDEWNGVQVNGRIWIKIK